MKQFEQKLQSLKEQGRYRSLALPKGVDLTSNDYLSLVEHPALRDAAIDFLQNGGDIGAGGSRLLRGHTSSHAALEQFACDFFAAPAALYFATGFQANAALFQALLTRHDTIIFDEYVHASAREAIQNSHARRIKVQHNNLHEFENAIKEARASGRETIWVAVESVYSMDGDIAPLQELHDLAIKHDAMLIVDEAHGTGVMGETGRGLSEEIIQSHGYDRLVVLHTCGKAIGVAGGLVCASRVVVEALINSARAFIYSTAPLPLQAVLVQKSLEIIGSDEGAKRRATLRALSQKAQQIFGGAGTHIVPVIIGDDARAVEIAEMLQQKGWDIRAIRPPTVPEGGARLRLSLSANLSENQLEEFAADYAALIG